MQGAGAQEESGKLSSITGQPQPLLGIFQLWQAPPVAALLNQHTSFLECIFIVEQPGAGQGDVGEVELHAAALGNALGFGQISLRAVRVVQAVAQPGKAALQHAETIISV